MGWRLHGCKSNENEGSAPNCQAGRCGGCEAEKEEGGIKMIDYLFILVVVVFILFILVYIITGIFRSHGYNSVDRQSEAIARQIIEICKKTNHADVNRYIQSCTRYKIFDHIEFQHLVQTLKSGSGLSQLSKEERQTIAQLIQQYEQLDKKKMSYVDISNVKPYGGGGGSGTAQKTGNDAAKKVVKGAVIGAVIAGDAGAIVGATAAKAKLDAEQTKTGGTAGKDAAKQVVKGAVIGAVIAGDTGAIVGATAAKAKNEATNSQK